MCIGYIIRPTISHIHSNGSIIIFMVVPIITAGYINVLPLSVSCNMYINCRLPKIMYISRVPNINVNLDSLSRLIHSSSLI